MAWADNLSDVLGALKARNPEKAAAYFQSACKAADAGTPPKGE
jgi:hypothetical protein